MSTPAHKTFAGLALLLALAAPANAAEWRAVWVDAWYSPQQPLNLAEVQTLLGRVGDANSKGRLREANCNTIIMQVRRRADVCYPSGMGEPYMSGLSPSNFNALQAILDAAHDTTGGKKRIDVHCWVVAFKTAKGDVYDAHSNPADPDNYWPTRLSSVTGSENSDGAFDPGHPKCLKYLVDVCMDLVTRFDIDGIHYDYIRFEDEREGFNPTSVARYKARYGLATNPVSSNEQFKQWRRDQVTAFVRQVYARIQAVKPHVKQSGSFVTWNASPLASTREAFYATRPYWDVYSDWDSWIQEGIVDMAVPMTYYDWAALPADFTRWMNFEKDRKGNRHMIIGPGTYHNNLDNAIYELQQTRWPSPAGNYAHGFSAYCYRNPYYITWSPTVYGSWENFAPRLLSDVTPTWEDIPAMPWKTSPTKAHIMGTVTHAADGSWADHARVKIVGPSPSTAEKTMYVDGTGFYAFIDLQPGTYTITASKTGSADVSTTVTIAVGAVTGNMYVRDLQFGAVSISNVQASNVDDNGATITWNTNIPSDSLVQYGPTTSYGSSKSNTALVTSHTINLTGLQEHTLYHYRVTSAAGGISATSEDYTFQTAGPPIISSVQASNVTGTSATIVWTTDSPSSSQVRYGLTASYGTSTPTNYTDVISHSVNLSGLQPNTLYHYQVVSSNDYGTTSSSDFTFTTVGPPTITNVAASEVTTDSATITWTTSSPASSQVNYGTTSAYGSQSTLDPATVTSHSVTLSGLQHSTLYHYQAVSSNAYGTAQSEDFTFTTQGPPVISDVAASNIGAAGATITWTTDVPGDTQVEYGFTAGYGFTTALQPALVTSHSAGLTGLAPNTLYHYRVRSANPAGATYSGDYTFTTTDVEAEILIDNTDPGWTNTSTSGGWTIRNLAGVPKIGANYLTAAATGIPQESSANKSCRWTPNIAAFGIYDVWVYYQIGPNRNNAAPYKVFYHGGSLTSVQNQYSPDPETGGWFQIGWDLPFAAGTSGYVQLANNSADTRLISADAAKFIRKGGDPSAPSQPVVTDDGLFTASRDSLHAAWSASDPESGIQSYEYRIRETAGAIIRDWTVTTATEVTVGGLTLPIGSVYYFDVRATNNQAMVGPVGASDGITIFTFDVSGDGKLNDVDLAGFINCSGGADLPYGTGGSTDCSRFDADADNDVDVDDFGRFQRCLTGTADIEPSCLN